MSFLFAAANGYSFGKFHWHVGVVVTCQTNEGIESGWVAEPLHHIHPSMHAYTQYGLKVVNTHKSSVTVYLPLGVFIRRVINSSQK